jgi:inner membrane protein
MTAKGHFFLALIPSEIVAFTFFNQTEEQISFLAGAALGSLLPDIDEPRSYIGRKFPYFAIPLKLLGLKHRTFTHSIWFALVFLFFGILIQSVFLYGIALGVFMHLIGDMLTKGGVPLFYPSEKHYRLLPKDVAIYTNSLTEHLLIAVFLVINTLLITAYVSVNFEEIKELIKFIGG